MPAAAPIQSSFNGGEFGSLVYARVDSERHKTGLAVCVNYVPTLQGPLTRRSGSVFVAESSSTAHPIRLIPFEFSTTQAYMLEFGHHYIRFYKDNSLIVQAAKTITGASVAAGTGVVTVTSTSHGFSNGDRVIITGVLGMTQLNNREFVCASVATNTFNLLEIDGSTVLDGSDFDTYVSGGEAAEVYEVATTYDYSDLFELKYTQSADILYITHNAYAPRKLSRTGHTSWTLTSITFLDGPYYPQNITATTLTPSATTGVGITITADALTGINSDTGFQTTDIGRVIRIKNGSAWGYARITARTTALIVVATVVSAFAATSGATTWRLGLWSDTTAYPSCVVFHEDRLFFGGALPQRVDGSNSGDYENFAPSDAPGTVSPDNAVSYSLNASDVNVVKWMTSDEKGLLCGTTGGEWVVKPSSSSEKLTPTNVSAKQATSYGSGDIQPVQMGKATLFLQKSGKKIREMTFFYDVDGYRSGDLTQLSPHILGTGLTQIARQKDPQTLLWGVRNDGVLVTMTYERDIDSFKVGWSRHIVAGYSNTYRDNAKVESIAVIPSADGLKDDVWISVLRTIDGVDKRYIEYLSKIFEDTDDLVDANLLDCSITYDGGQTGIITGSSITNDITVSLASHGYTTGDRVYIRNSEGWELDTKSCTVTVLNSSTFTLDDLDASEFGVFITGFGYVTGVADFAKYVTTIEGLNHLENSTVQLLGNGAVLPAVIVTNGKITLSQPAAIVQIGFAYNSDGQMLRLDAGSANGTSLGKTKRTHRVGFYLHNTLGLKFGTDFDHLDEYVFRSAGDETDSPIPLFSGIISETVESDYDFENQIAWRQSDPLPGTILAVMPQLVTQDRG